MTIDIAAIKARRAAVVANDWRSTILSRDYGVFDALNGCVCVVDGRYPIPAAPVAKFIAAAPADIDALLAEVERLQTAIRNAETLSEVTHLVGPSETENEEARRRLEQMDGINAKYGVDIAKWPDHVYLKWTRLNITQGAFERRYA